LTPAMKRLSIGLPSGSPKSKALPGRCGVSEQTALFPIHRSRNPRLDTQPLPSIIANMARTRTKSVDLQKLALRGESSSTVIKLMMACNDLSLAGKAFSEWGAEQPSSTKHRQAGARMYFVRMQISHLHEGFKVLEALRKDKTLLNLLGQCDRQTQESFEKLEEFMVGGARHDEFQRLAGQIRHNLCFHYDKSGKVIQKALSDRASRPEAQRSLATRADPGYLWHFKVADDITDSIVVRQIWKIPRDADIRAEADKISEHVFLILMSFVDFAGEFIWNYCKS
jgi:hypothetical protein